MAIWAAGFLITKDVLGVLAPFTVLAIRFFVAALVLLVPVMQWHGLRLERCDVLPVVACSLLNPIAYNILGMYGLRLTSASHAAVLGGTFPVLVCLLSGIAGLESMTKRRVAGVIATAVGIGVVGALGTEGSGASISGDGITVAGLLCAAIQIVWLKQLLTRISPLKLLFYQRLIGLAVFVPAMLVEGTPQAAQLTPVILLEAISMGILGTTLAFGLHYYALRRLSATSVATANGLIPVFALALEVLVWGLVPSLPGRILGALFVIAGMVLTQSAEKRWFGRRSVPEGEG